jgi:hypothetical protein
MILWMQNRIIRINDVKKRQKFVTARNEADYVCVKLIPGGTN